MSAGSTIEIPDNFQKYPVDSLRFPAHYKSLVESVVIPNGFVLDRISRMAEEIFEDLQPHCGEDGLHALCVLKGAFVFYSDLQRALENVNYGGRSLKVNSHFIRAKSYVDDASTGNLQVTLISDLASVLSNKIVLIVEDIVDTGNTLKNLVPHLQQFNPKMIKVASLFLKRTPLHNGFMPDYIGFSMPNKFLVGYALDYNEHYRDLKHVCVINDAGKEKFASEKSK